jgi:rapamycin-insensitive companion of mTOR
MLKVKGCLWAVGNIGSMELGAPFLENSNVLDWIIKIVEQSGVMTMRGTAFFVLGLISRSWHGMEILAQRGWDAATNHLGQSLGYLLPPSLDLLFPKRPKVLQPLPPPLVTIKDMPKPLDPNDALEKKIYSAAIESGNTVLSRKALNDMNS